MRAGVGVAMTVALLSVVVSAQAAQPKIFLDARPAIATGAGQTVVAWTAGGIVQIASENADGSFAPGSAVGRSIGSSSPQLAITPSGEQIVVWQSLRTLRSAVRYSPETAWKYQNIAPTGRFSDPHLAMDASGRAIVTWVTQDGARSSTSSLYVSIRPPLGSWSPPSQQLVGPAPIGSSSLAVDSDGDIVVAYAAVPTYGPNAGTDRQSLYALTLPSGATAWTAPVVISGSDLIRSGPRVEGGGARTFVVTWTAAGPVPPTPPVPESVLRTARLRLPEEWEAPQMLLPPQDAQTGLAFATVAVLRVDALGSALALLQYGVTAGSALDSVRLPASAAAWDAPVVVDAPQGGTYLFDSPPALALADDGSATLAFLRMSAEGNTLRLATTQDYDVWQGAQTDVGRLRSCPPGSIPGHSIYCPVATQTTPAVAAGSPGLAIAVQGIDEAMFAFTRAASDAPWTGPEPIVAVGRTQASLRGGTSRPGSVQIVATCTLPPCRGVAVLRMRDKPNRVLGSASFILERAGGAVRTIALPLWARTRIARRSGLWTRLTFGVHEGDGTSEQTRLPFLLSGKSWIRTREGG